MFPDHYLQQILFQTISPEGKTNDNLTLNIIKRSKFDFLLFLGEKIFFGLVFAPCDATNPSKILLLGNSGL